MSRRSGTTVALKRLVDPARPITYGIVQAGEDVPGGVPYIRPVDMVPFARTLDPTSLRTTSRKIASQFGRSAVRGGDLVVSIGPSFGKTLVVPAALSGANLTQGTARVAPADGVDVRFLQWALAAPAARAYWQAAVGGATFGGLNLGPLAQTPVPMREAGEQRDIADFLDRECDRVALLASRLERLQGLATEAHFARIEEVVWRDGAVEVPLVELTDRSRPIMYGILMPGPHVPGGVPIVHGGHVEGGHLDPEHLPRTTRELHAEYSRSQLRAGDLVMSVRGSYGAVAVVPDRLSGGNVSRDAARISPHPDVSADWLRFALLAPASQSALRITVVGTGVKGINIGAIRRLRLPLLPATQRNRDAALLAKEEATFRRIGARTGTMVGRLSEYRDALITEAVTGRLDVSRLSDAQLDESAQAVSEGALPEVLSA